MRLPDDPVVVVAAARQQLAAADADRRQLEGELLQLPRLGALCADSIRAPQGQDLSGCAITRLALDQPAAGDLQALPQLPVLHSLCDYDARKTKSLPPVNRRWVKERAERVRASPGLRPLP